jgi:glucokinase
MPTILAADIGATNSRFALFAAEPNDEAQPLLRLEREIWLAVAQYSDFAAALDALLCPREEGGSFLDPAHPPDVAVLAPAGAVEGDVCHMTNCAWVVRGDDARHRLGIAQVGLVNDFVAQAYACLLPQAVDMAAILPGRPVPGSPQAVIGAGTGLGKALIVPGDIPAESGENRRQSLRRLAAVRVLPSEGGHEDFPFVGEEEFAFAAFAAKRRQGRLYSDYVVSGPGLAAVVAFLTGLDLTPPEAAAEALRHPQVLDWFARLYGRACRNFALNTLALGGVTITGGMALRLPVLDRPAFRAEFHENDPHQRRLLEALPVFHMRSPRAGLWGAALYGVLRLAQDTLDIRQT